MDPDAALTIIRECIAAEDAVTDSTSALDRLDTLVTLAETFRALDEWIKKGGFLPRDWQRNPERRRDALMVQANQLRGKPGDISTALLALNYQLQLMERRAR